MNKKEEKANEEFFKRFGEEGETKHCNNGQTCIMHAFAKARRIDGKPISVDELSDFFGFPSPPCLSCDVCKSSAFGKYIPLSIRKRIDSTRALVRPKGWDKKPIKTVHDFLRCCESLGAEVRRIEGEREAYEARYNGKVVQIYL